MKKLTLREKARIYLEEQHLLDDYPFQVACKYSQTFVKNVIKRITGQDVEIEKIETQEHILNPQGKEIITDVMVYAKDGTIYDLEPNTYRKGEVLERGIFHTGMLHSKLLQPSEDWTELKRGVVIMLNKHDILKHDKAVEKFELTHSDTKEKASEKGVVLYMVNCSHQGRDKEEKDFFHDLMADYVKEELYFAENKTVVDYILGREEQYKMTERQERMIENERKEAAREAAKKAAKKAKVETTRDILKTLIDNGFDASAISKALNLSSADINKITRNLW